MSEDQIAAARDAWVRICRRGQTTFDDWVLIGRAVAIGRAECLKIAGSNRPFGKKYTAAMGLWLANAGLDGIHQQERYWALKIVDNIAEIEAWRATLDDAGRRHFNHPQSIWTHWRRSLGAERSKPPPREQRRPRSGRAIFWGQDHIRRAAHAMRESRSSDYFVLARVALQAAIRTESDIEALLSPR
jgi:hypothetical protein